MISELVTYDCDQLADCLAATDQEFCQLAPGEFTGRFRRIDLPGIHITEEYFSHSVACSVEIPQQFVTMLVPIQQDGMISVEGHDGSQRDLFLGQPETEAELKLTPEYHCYSVEIDVEMMRRAAEALHIGLPNKLPKIIRLPDVKATNMLRAVVNDSFSQLWRNAHSTSLLGPSNCSDQILTAFLKAMQVAAQKPEPICRLNTARRRQAALEAAEFVTANLATPVTVTNLCEITRVGERSLRDGFRDVFGVSPNRFIKSQRLAAARQELRQASADNTTVSQIAARWGFLQFAHFATDYRAQFSERPSDTLARSD